MISGSFSEVIKAHFVPAPTVGAFKAAIRNVRISEDALDAMDKIVRDRVKSPVRIPRL